MHRKLEALAQIVGKTGHFLRLGTGFAAHAQGIADHNFGDVVLAEKVGEGLEIQPLVLPPEGGQALSRNAKGV